MKFSGIIGTPVVSSKVGTITWLRIGLILCRTFHREPDA